MENEIFLFFFLPNKMFKAAEGLGEHVNLIWKPPKQRLSENEKIDVIKTV